jgi:hypothetical protein
MTNSRLKYMPSIYMKTYSSIQQGNTYLMQMCSFHFNCLINMWENWMITRPWRADRCGQCDPVIEWEHKDSKQIAIA